MKNRFSQITTLVLKKIASVFLGLILSLVLLEAGLRLGGFILSSIQEFENLQSVKQKGVYRILCLGESTTERQYPQLLEQILNRRNIGVRFKVIDKGRSAINTFFILGQIESYLAAYHPDMVVTMMGINDQYIKYYQDIAESRTWIFRHCRVYRFGRMLCGQIFKKIKREDIFGLSGPDSNRKALSEEAGTVPEKANPPNEISAKKTPRSDLKWAGEKSGTQTPSLDEGRLSDAEKSLRKTIELDPKNDSAYVGLGRLYLGQSEFSQAEESYRKALEINPENARAYAGLGRIYRLQGKFPMAADLFKKAIELNPKNDNTYVGLGWLYLGQSKFSQAEGSYRKALEINPENAGAYAGLGQLYRLQGQFSQAEDCCEKAIVIDPESDKARAGLGQIYLDQGKFSEAEKLFKKAIELNPKNDSAYVELGGLYRQRAKISQAEVYFKKALEVNPKNEDACLRLGWHYKYQGEFAQAEDFGRKAIEINPRNDSAYFALGVFYREQGKLSQAEDAFRRVIEIKPENERVLGAMSSLYQEMGKPELAQDYAEKAARLKFENYPVITVNNYRKLKGILDQKGVKLVCAQYPLRKVELLKKIFENDTGVIFVDNEKVFKEALKKNGYRYKEYFKDMFGGDFGHCTLKGNELLAQNIADVILKEVFNR